MPGEAVQVGLHRSWRPLLWARLNHTAVTLGRIMDKDKDGHLNLDELVVRAAVLTARRKLSAPNGLLTADYCTGLRR